MSWTAPSAAPRYVRPGTPVPETHKTLRCPGCRCLDIQVRSSEVSAGYRVNRLACKACGHSWQRAGGLMRILVEVSDGREQGK